MPKIFRVGLPDELVPQPAVPALEDDSDFSSLALRTVRTIFAANVAAWSLAAQLPPNTRNQPDEVPQIQVQEEEHISAIRWKEFPATIVISADDEIVPQPPPPLNVQEEEYKPPQPWSWRGTKVVLGVEDETTSLFPCGHILTEALDNIATEDNRLLVTEACITVPLPGDEDFYTPPPPWKKLGGSVGTVDDEIVPQPPPAIVDEDFFVPRAIWPFGNGKIVAGDDEIQILRIVEEDAPPIKIWPWTKGKIVSADDEIQILQVEEEYGPPVRIWPWKAGVIVAADDEIGTPPVFVVEELEFIPRQIWPQGRGKVVTIDDETRQPPMPVEDFYLPRAIWPPRVWVDPNAIFARTAESSDQIIVPPTTVVDEEYGPPKAIWPWKADKVLWTDDEWPTPPPPIHVEEDFYRPPKPLWWPKLPLPITRWHQDDPVPFFLPTDIDQYFHPPALYRNRWVPWLKRWWKEDDEIIAQQAVASQPCFPTTYVCESASPVALICASDPTAVVCTVVEAPCTLVPDSALCINLATCEVPPPPPADLHLQFSIQPSDDFWFFIFNTPLSGPPTVEVRDVNENVVTTFTGDVTIAVQIVDTFPPGEEGLVVVSGVLTVPLVNGVAAFNDIEINPTDTGPEFGFLPSTADFTLLASCPGVHDVTSVQFSLGFPT